MLVCPVGGAKEKLPVGRLDTRSISWNKLGKQGGSVRYLSDSVLGCYMDDSTRFCSNSILDQNRGNYSTKSHDEILLKLDTRRKFLILLDDSTRWLDEILPKLDTRRKLPKLLDEFFLVVESLRQGVPKLSNHTFNHGERVNSILEAKYGEFHKDEFQNFLTE